MLRRVKEFISEVPNKSFPEYFTEYIIKVQDENLSEEVSRRFKATRASIDSLSKTQRWLQQENERLVNMK